MDKFSFLDNGFKYPKITRRVDFENYHPDLAGNFVDVWVNWPRRMSEESLALALESADISVLPLGEERDKRLATLNERMWQFHAEWLGVPLEQIQQLYQIDTNLYEWIIAQASYQRREYGDERKKVGESSTPM